MLKIKIEHGNALGPNSTYCIGLKVVNVETNHSYSAFSSVSDKIKNIEPELLNHLFETIELLFEECYLTFIGKKEACGIIVYTDNAVFIE